MPHAIIARSSRDLRTRLWAGALVLLAACADSAGPRVSDGPVGDSVRPATQALISASTTTSQSTAAAVVLGRTYVSMPPRTEPLGDTVTIVRLGGGSATGTRMTDGGFDPVALDAMIGDTLAISVHRTSGATSTTYGVVPVKSKPVVVRTSPPDGRTDVPLNCVIQVVFSEPMDSLSLVDALHLQLHGVGVPGTVSAVTENGGILVARLIPAVSLQPGSSYQVSVTTDAHNPDGTPLAAAVQVSFVTQSTSPGGTGGGDTLTGGTGAGAAQLLSLFPTGAPAGSPDVSLSIVGYFLGQGYTVGYSSGGTIVLTTPSGGSAAVTATLPAALLRTPGTLEVFVYTGDPSDGLPHARSNILTFQVTGPLPPPGNAVIVVQDQDSVPYGPITGWREVSLDGTAPRTLYQNGSLTYDHLAVGAHRLDLSNPCTGTHQPTIMNVTAVEGSTVTLKVYVPPDCE